MKTKEQIEAKIALLLEQAKESDKQAYAAWGIARKELQQNESKCLRLQAFILSWVLKE